MSKARDEYNKFQEKMKSIMMGVNVNDAVTNYVHELETEKAELIEYVKEVVFAIESFQTEKEWNALKKLGLKMIEKNWKEGNE